MLPFEIREQLNLTLARAYLTFKGELAKRDCTSDISNIVAPARHVYPRVQMPAPQTYLCPRAYLFAPGKQCKVMRIYLREALPVKIKRETGHKFSGLVDNSCETRTAPGTE